MFVTVAIASVCAHYGGYQAVFDSWQTFWVEVREHLARYVFEGPNIEISNMIVAATALTDGLLVYLVVRAALPRGSEVSLLSAAAAAGIAAAVFGFYQWRTHVGLSSMWVENDPGIIRINATYTDPNALASYFALLIPIALGLAARETVSRARMLWLAGVAAMSVALVMTAGRAGLLAACAGVAVWIVLALVLRLDRDDPWPFVRRHFRKVVYGVAIASALTLFALVAIGTALDIRHHHQNTYLHTWLFTFNVRQPLDQIVKGRFSNWQTAALMVQDHPIFGIGIGRVFRLFANYNRLVGGAPEGARFSAHNTFLNVTAEMGIVGLLAFLTLLGVTFSGGDPHAAPRRWWRGGASHGAAACGSDRGVIWVLVGLIAGLAAYTLTMIPGDRLILREDVVTFAALLAIVACLRDVIPAPAAACRLAARAPRDLDAASGAHRHGGDPRDGAGARDAGAAHDQARSRHVRAARRRRRGRAALPVDQRACDVLPAVERSAIDAAGPIGRAISADRQHQVERRGDRSPDADRSRVAPAALSAPAARALVGVLQSRTGSGAGVASAQRWPRAGRHARVVTAGRTRVSDCGTPRAASDRLASVHSPC